jgi:hypothetical protein
MLTKASPWFARWRRSGRDSKVPWGIGDKMLEPHPFTYKIEPDPLDAARFRWTVCEGAQIQVRSPRSYASRGEAKEAASEALLRLAETWPRRRPSGDTG